MLLSAVKKIPTVPAQTPSNQPNWPAHQTVSFSSHMLNADHYANFSPSSVIGTDRKAKCEKLYFLHLSKKFEICYFMFFWVFLILCRWPIASSCFRESMILNIHTNAANVVWHRRMLKWYTMTFIYACVSSNWKLIITWYNGGFGANQ